MTDMHELQQHEAEPRGLPRLLIADDDPVVVSMLSAQLSNSFEIVASARDADEAIACGARHRPDAAIIDVQMPAGGGLRAARELHACSPATAIVALSGDESDSVVRDVIAAGAITYVRKGIPGHELTATIHRSIEAHARLGAWGAAASDEQRPVVEHGSPANHG